MLQAVAHYVACLRIPDERRGNVEEEDPMAGIAWRNALTEERRSHWLMMAASAMPAAARHAYLLAQAYNDALDEAGAWIGVKS